MELTLGQVSHLSKVIGEFVMLYWLHGYMVTRRDGYSFLLGAGFLSNRQEKMWQDVAQPWPIRKADNKAVEALLNTRCKDIDLLSGGEFYPQQVCLSCLCTPRCCVG